MGLTSPEAGKRAPTSTTPPWWGEFSDWPEAHPLGYSPYPGSFLGSTLGLWGLLSSGALGRRL